MNHIHSFLFREYVNTKIRESIIASSLFKEHCGGQFAPCPPPPPIIYASAQKHGKYIDVCPFPILLKNINSLIYSLIRAVYWLGNMYSSNAATRFPHTCIAFIHNFERHIIWLENDNYTQQEIHRELRKGEIQL